jgi:hypothetical protein
VLPFRACPVSQANFLLLIHGLLSKYQCASPALDYPGFDHDRHACLN